MVQNKLRILLAETEPSETADTLRALFPDAAGGLDLTVVSTMATLVPTAKIVDPEIILLDLELSLRDPLDAVHLVHRSAPGIPLVVLANPAQKQFAAQSLSEGAIDYVLKGFMNERTLGRVLRTALERNFRRTGRSVTRSDDRPLHARRAANARLTLHGRSAPHRRVDGVDLRAL
jgi:DNA-binding NtrC family response regulator